MDPTYRAKLIRQHNKFIGEHTSVQICGWTKKALRGEGACYKGKFYGIKSHRCVQMSPAVNFCDHDCVFCWRERNNSGFGKIDDPNTMTARSIDAQRKLLSGFGGNDKVPKDKYEEACDPLHFAISLNGEPTYYPRLSEFIKDLKKKNLSSFIVTNGQLPDVLRKIEQPTQLYLSLDAPNKELYKEIDRPMRDDGWERVLETLDLLKELREAKKTRTVIRITVIKGLNDHNPEEWAALIERAKPMFIEIKSYMHLGASRERLTQEHMPFHEDIIAFTKEICKHCSYTIVSEHKPSRVCLLMEEENKDAPWRYIDFAEEKDVWKRGESKPLLEIDEAGEFVGCGGSNDESSDELDDELTVEKAEKLIKIK
ncbi:4-demethylwyosine synthase TYW1 [Candidatus Woesearchaeota archaeon]|nr:4-demethylwyosine synthase TYW1 [Candidatus Woesearchaeota archaeon]